MRRTLNRDFAYFGRIIEAVIVLSTIYIVASPFIRFLALFPPNPTMVRIFTLDKMEYIAYGVGLLTAFVIYTQLILLQKQVAAQTLIELSKQWNDARSFSRRKDAAAVLQLNQDQIDTQSINLDHLEQVLEGLEDFSTFARMEVVLQDLVWESQLGWYAVRYFYYTNDNGSLKQIRASWCSQPSGDRTLYWNLEWLYKEYVRREVDEREITIADLKNDYNKTKQKFIDSEKGLPDEK